MRTPHEKFDHLSQFDNVLIVDKEGYVLFYDLADLYVLQELGQKPEDFLGNKVTSFYSDLTDENSTLLNVMRTGQPIVDVRQEIHTNAGNVIVSRNSSYPIVENGQIIGAIEFSKHFFSKEHIKKLDRFASNKVYRKNNTIYTIENLISESGKMEEIKEKIRKTAKTNSTVLIYGRTGTGKEVVAQAIHNLSNRFGSPFISLNCSAIPATLMESTLFGTTKGSFTGAEDMPGVFEQANGGTLFLDEINSLDMNLQAKLLKAIEEKTIRRIGGTKSITLDIRIISATNEDPELLVEEKRMREDLFYRLGVVQLNLPSLSERKEDILPITKFYIDFYNTNMDTYIDRMDNEVIDLFLKYGWPGNIRELKNAIETAYNNVNSSTITVEDLPDRIKGTTSFHSKKRYDSVQQAKALKEAVEDYEKNLIVNGLEQSKGTIAETARQLGISKQLLKYKMDKYQLR
ncbi:sigma-54 interaction domain-containing protein [Bacillus sp. 1P06AnD]|uniref:sigma-54 interaction domain-containing protein n=1 Tax=Bacillus sp. 1P06AnD TaxID=3132208 RepID=UPI0039A27CAB